MESLHKQDLFPILPSMVGGKICTREHNSPHEKVNIHCDGCKQKVKKLLQRIEGVYQVQLDAEQQKVTVSGSVDSGTLIKKLLRAGKYAELWSQKTNQNQNQNQNQKNNNHKNICVKDDKNKGQKQGMMVKGFETFNKKNQKFPALSSEEDDEYCDEEEDDEEDGLRFIRERANQINLLKQQQQQQAANAKKNFGAAINGGGVSSSNGKASNSNGGKKGGFDPKTMASALQMNNPYLGGRETETRRVVTTNNDIGTMMNLAGFNNANHNHNTATVGLGGGFNSGFHGFQGHSSSGIIPNGGFTTNQQQYPSSSSSMMNMNGFNNHPLTMNMKQQQPQMMYQRAPYVPPNTGYHYYNNYSPPSMANYSHLHHNHNYNHNHLPSYYSQDDHYTADMFSDDNTNTSCTVM
ncbi:heavy metal-associated isoprenylated plant protein 37 [Senna tora]|uniref:Heavy metal-associated isoprenylated plant protein 37 n=1 Tax=Senna tora TaxID=362788 RepID=A0A834TWK4_9FABA|nr:heavy metal-associated isoprenylated plant protein 37 [Senna tora]